MTICTICIFLGIIIIIIPVSTRWHGGIIFVIIIPVSTRWHVDEWFRRRLEESRHGGECFRRRILIIIIIGFFFLLRLDLRRGATPCGGRGTRLVGMVTGLMRLVFAMPTKAISQRSFMWYFKSDYTRLSITRVSCGWRPRDMRGNIKGILDTGAYLVLRTSSN